jgi:hypothetical protein
MMGIYELEISSSMAKATSMTRVASPTTLSMPRSQTFNNATTKSRKQAFNAQILLGYKNLSRES